MSEFKEEINYKAAEADIQSVKNLSLIEGDGTAQNPFIIMDVEGFNRIRDNVNAYYKLGGDVDFQGETILPIGTSSMHFVGGLDGDGYSGLFRYAKGAKFKNLIIKNATNEPKSSVSNNGVLAGYLERCSVENIHLIDITVEGGYTIGALAGATNYGSIIRCSVSGEVSINGLGQAGGMIGSIDDTTVNSCFVKSNGKVCGTGGAGGLIRGARAGVVVGIVQCCGAAIETIGKGGVGGLIGATSAFTIITVKQCYATGSVVGEYNVGGLIGSSNNTEINDSFALGSVTSTLNNVSVGGLLGYADRTKIRTSYATGKVSTGGSGLVYYSATVTNSYFDSTLSGITTPTAQARTTTQLLESTTYVGWNWKLYGQQRRIPIQY